MKIYVHEKFDHRKVLPRKLWPYREDAAYLLHLVYQHGLLRHGATARKDRTVNLKYDYLTKVTDDRHFCQIRDALEKRGWLLCDHESEEGSKAFSYSLGPKATRGHFREVPLTKKRLINKIEKWKAERDSDLTPVMKHIVGLLPEITLDESVVDVLVQEGGFGSRQALTEQFMFVRNGSWFSTRCDAGRLYTNVTSLRTDGRGALWVNGNCLHNVDVSDSQFHALVILIENAFHGRRLDYIKASPSTNDPLLGVDPFTIVPHFPDSKPFIPKVELFPLITISSRKKKKARGGSRERKECLTTCIKWKKTTTQGAKSDEEVVMSLQDDEWQLFRQLAQAGKLKNYVSKRLRTSRNRTKEILMKWVFGRTNQEAKAARRLEAVFPKLFHFLRHVKQEKKGNKWLAHLLTRIESKLMLDSAALRISQERPDMFMTTIHDSIMVEPDNVQYVKSVLTDVYRQQDLDVHLKVEEEFKRKQ